METSTNIYLNGEFLPREEARITVMDRGFLFGDGVYEVIPCYSGRLFRLGHHLKRLDDSLAGIRMENPHGAARWREILEALVAQQPCTEMSLYLQVTRGSTGGRDHAIPRGIPPTVFAMTMPFEEPDPKLALEGVKAVTLDDLRWHLCNIKAITLLANVLAKQEARDQGAVEAILVRDGLAHEGAASNLFIVEQGVVTTPPKSHNLLPGITRDLVLELALRKGIPAREEEITEQRLVQADELWLTSSTKEVIPVTHLNDNPVGNGRPGPMFQRMASLYADYKARIKAGLEE
ncbi:MAG TPA: D-amino acid aminotransferase [Sedimenticola sp.]|nr:D-amino acid aminotransferase [Sedimenticola sp.]